MKWVLVALFSRAIMAVFASGKRLFSTYDAVSRETCENSRRAKS